MTKIYEIIDADDGMTYYVGKTNNSLADRLYGHLRGSVRVHARSAPALLWFHDCLVAGREPHIELIEEVPNDEWRAAENKWVIQRRNEGHPLKNAIAGGNGYDNRRPTFAHLAELAKAHDRDVIRTNNSSGQEKAFLAAMARTGAPDDAEAAARASWQSWADEWNARFGVKA